MSWCPNCRSEYVNGRQTCYDCGAVLVESLDDIQNDAGNMYDFDSLSDEMKRRVLAEMQKENLDPRKLLNPTKEGSVDFVARMIEEENAPSREEYEQELAKEAKKTPAPFVKQEDKLSNYRSGAYACLIVGVAGLIYMAAEIAGFINLAGNTNYIFLIVMTAMFAGFVLAGIYSLVSARKIKARAVAENAYIRELEGWILENINKDYVNEGIDQTLNINALYELRAARIREALLQRDSGMNPSMLEHYVENTYITLFES